MGGAFKCTPPYAFMNKTNNGCNFAVWGVRVSGRGLQLTSDLLVVPRLRKSGVIPTLFLYALLAWTRATLNFKEGVGVLAL
jgi:hypothetical protein